MNKKLRPILAMLLVICMVILSACSGQKQGEEEVIEISEATGTETSEAQPTPEETPAAEPESTVPETQEPEEETYGKNGEVYVLYTSDIHCGVDQGFGMIGLWQVISQLEAAGYTTILVDNGDAIQGEPLGTLTKGEAMVDLMNIMRYSVAIPGNHEFDYGMDQFLALADRATYTYVSCNFNKNGELVFDPYVIENVCGIRIAFVGVTTPVSITSSTPTSFQDAEGNYIYGFMQDSSGYGVYEAVQSAVDAARAEGADLVYVMGHLGLEEDCQPWTYADVIANTSGIDVFLDGHSHDTEQVVMKDKDGKDVVRSACGTKLANIGYSHISADGVVLETGIWSWPNDVSAVELFGIENENSQQIKMIMDSINETMESVVATTTVDLTIYDPVEKDLSGNKVRMIRRAETNMGDLVTDALLAQTGADIAMMNGGGIRDDIQKGEITYGDIIKVMPFGNELTVIEVTGSQILDALEWGARSVPGETGGFMQVAGLTYEIHTYIDTPCVTDENSMCAGIEGERRVKNVMVGGEPIDPYRTYTLAGTSYTLLLNGDGYTAFDGAEVIETGGRIDNAVLIDYIVGDLGGQIGAKYADPYGEGRIVIVEEAPETE